MAIRFDIPSVTVEFDSEIYNASGIAVPGMVSVRLNHGKILPALVYDPEADEFFPTTHLTDAAEKRLNKVRAGLAQLEELIKVDHV